MYPSHRIPQLSAAKPRSGMRSFAELVDCLIRVYEKQNEVEDRLNQQANPNRVANKNRTNENRSNSDHSNSARVTSARGASARSGQNVEPTRGTSRLPTLTVHMGNERQTTFGFYDSAIV